MIVWSRNDFTSPRHEIKKMNAEFTSSLPQHWPTLNGETCRFSMDRKYRYTLWRFWAAEVETTWFRSTWPEDGTQPVKISEPSKFLMVIGLNPSTADETKNDPTIRRCIAFAQRWGFGGLCMTNLFAYRATDPRDMRRCQHPVGDENDYWLQKISSSPNAGMVLAAWGNHGGHQNRSSHMLELVSEVADVHCLRVTGKGHPEHPLYIPTETMPWIFKKKNTTTTTTKTHHHEPECHS